MGAEQKRLVLGRRVELHSLQTAALNGQTGVAVKFDAETGRYVVEIQGEAKLKLMKRENLRQLDPSGEDTVDVVVIPTRGSMYYVPVTATDSGARMHAIYGIFEGLVKRNERLLLASPYYHYFHAVDETRWMCMFLLDSFWDERENETMTKLGWNNGTWGLDAYGPVVVMFSSDVRGDPPFITTYEPFPYDGGHLQKIIREHAGARTIGSSIRDRILRGEYLNMPAMPGKITEA